MVGPSLPDAVPAKHSFKGVSAADAEADADDDLLECRDPTSVL